jgi:hypothetical protein
MTTEQPKQRTLRNWTAEDDAVLMADIKAKVSTEEMAKKLNRTPGAVKVRINKNITHMYKSGNDFDAICAAIPIAPEDIKKTIKIFEDKKAKQQTRKEERQAERTEKVGKMKDVEHVKNRLNELQTQIIDIITELKEMNKLINTPVK